MWKLRLFYVFTRRPDYRFFPTSRVRVKLSSLLYETGSEVWLFVHVFFWKIEFSYIFLPSWLLTFTYIIVYNSNRVCTNGQNGFSTWAQILSNMKGKTNNQPIRTFWLKVSTILYAKKGVKELRVPKDIFTPFRKKSNFWTQAVFKRTHLSTYPSPTYFVMEM